MITGVAISTMRIPVVILSQISFHFLEWKKVFILPKKLSFAATLLVSLFIFLTSVWWYVNFLKLFNNTILSHFWREVNTKIKQSGKTY